MAGRLFYEIERVKMESEARCEDRLEKLIPDLFESSPMLYIGASAKRFWLREKIQSMAVGGGCVDVLEIWKPYCEELSALVWLRKIIHGDIVRYRRARGAYQAVIWWSGPEHVKRGLLAQAIANTEVLSRKWVLLSCPVGNMPQDAVDENPHQEHVTAIYPESLLALGYSVFTREFRPRSEKLWSGHMIAWKDVSEL